VEIDAMSSRFSTTAKQAPAQDKTLLRRSQASRYLLETYGYHCALATLAQYACRGTGPAFQYIERVPYYTPANLDKWITGRLGRPRVRSRQRNRRRAEASETFSTPTEPPQHHDDVKATPAGRPACDTTT
jgi:hypothetical protein